MHVPYRKKLLCPPDFRVSYRFFSVEEDGRQNLPYQGYRSDFWYSHSAHDGTNRIFMIWPEFLDESGETILENNIPVPQSGIADMWIINQKMRSYHRNKIGVGMIGYFMEGSRCVAVCTVTELISLLEDREIFKQFNR